MGVWWVFLVLNPFVFCGGLMGPIRGIRKKRKVVKKVVGGGQSTAQESGQGPADWWDDFSRRITGLYSS